MPQSFGPFSLTPFSSQPGSGSQEPGSLADPRANSVLPNGPAQQSIGGNIGSTNISPNWQDPTNSMGLGGNSTAFNALSGGTGGYNYNIYNNSNTNQTSSNNTNTSGGSTNPYTVPNMPAATYSGSNDYFSPAAVSARTAAANAMLGALGSGNVSAYQQAAANFLAASPAGSGLPVWASTITVDPKGNFINTNDAGMNPDGTVNPEGRMGYSGMQNPVPGTPNIASGTADFLGNTIGPQGSTIPTNIPGVSVPANGYPNSYLSPSVFAPGQSSPGVTGSTTNAGGNTSTAGSTPGGIDPTTWALISALYGSNPVTSALSSAGANSQLSSLLGNLFNSSLSSNNSGMNMLNIASLLNSLTGQRNQPTGILNPLFWGSQNGLNGNGGNLLGSLLSSLGLSGSPALGNFYPSYY